MQDPKLDHDDDHGVLSERLLDDDAEQQPNDHVDMTTMDPFRPQQQQSNETHGDEFVVDPTTMMMGNGGGLRHPSETAQTPVYRDASFAIIFILHIIVILFMAFTWGVSAMKYPLQYSNNDTTSTDSSTTTSTTSLGGLLFLCSLSCFISIIISATTLQIMMHHTETLIQTSLIVSCGIIGLLVIMFLLDGVISMAILWLFILLFTICYAKAVWYRIAFAAANLRTALSAIQTNAGICILAYLVAFLANLWVVIWFMAFLGVSYKESSCSTDGVCQSHMNFISIFLLLLSYHWTAQVFKNVLHVTCAGVVGTWWFAPQDASSILSPAIQDSFARATTYSFGSICMGSLLVAVIQTLTSLARQARRHNRGGMLLCIVECILHYLSRIAIYFNKWSYVYVGLYGYDYLSAGRKVLELFETRGWTTIINDNLVQRTLTLVSVVIGALSGFVGMLLAKATGWASTIFGENSDGIVFLVCFIVGISMASILMGVVLSAVDTVIVSFAEAPVEFETNHPALSQHMIEKWRAVYPNECGF